MLAQSFSFWPLVALVVGNLVGSGIFLFPSTLAPYGWSSFVGWSITTVGAILLSLMFGRLSQITPVMGGPHVYVRHAYGNLLGFLTAWSYWIMAWISNAALVVATVGSVLHAFNMPPLINGLAQVSLITLLTLLNCRSISFSSVLETILTLLKIVPLVALPLVALFMQPLDQLSYMTLSKEGVSFGSAIHMVAMLTIWSYIGIETGTVPAGGQQKSVARALIVGTLIAAAIYMMGMLAIMGTVPQAELMKSCTPYADLAARIFGDAWGRPLIVVATFLSCMGALNGWVLVAGHIGYSAGKEGLFMPIFARLNAAGVPTASMMISLLCSIPFLGLSLTQTFQSHFEFLVQVSVILTLIIYSACALSLWKLAQKKHDYILSIIGLLFTLAVLAATDVLTLIGCVSLILLGLVFWRAPVTKEALS